MPALLAFLNTNKYPASLDFLLMTLGPTMALIPLVERTRGPLARWVAVFGRVPFFFYVLQWITAHVSGMIVTAALGRSIAPYFMHILDLFSTQPPPDFGGPLWTVYVSWILSLIAIYPLCRWFAGVRARRRDWWLSYI